MVPIKTIKISENPNEDWDLSEKGHTVWIDQSSYYAYATIQHRLSTAFFTAELATIAGYDKPFKIDVFVPAAALFKFKSSDPETPFDRIEKWIMAMEPTRCPLLIRMYVYAADSYPSLGYSDSFNCVWPLKKPDVTRGYYITYQPYELYGSLGKFGSTPNYSTRNELGYRLQERVLDEANRLGIEVIKTDYTMSFDEAVAEISGSLGHFSYFGSTYYIAAALGVQSYIFGYLKSPIKIIEHIDGNWWPSPWGGNKVTQIKIDSNNGIREIFNAPVGGFSHIETYKDVRERLKECCP